jgi:hypothetical protein
MKTTDPRDPLDQKIDALLASKPVKSETDFTARVLSALDADLATQESTTPRGQLAPLLKFALPIAAAAALALTFIQFNKGDAPAAPSDYLTAAEAQEIFLLGEGLEGLSELGTESFQGQDFLSTLDALTFEIES